MMYWVCRKIGFFFFFLTVLKMEMVAENQRRVLPLLFGAWDWVTGARGSRASRAGRPPAPQHLPGVPDPTGDSQGGQGACSQSDLSEIRGAGRSTLGSRTVTFFRMDRRRF